jgi:hypothetical protein
MPVENSFISLSRVGYLYTGTTSLGIPQRLSPFQKRVSPKVRSLLRTANRDVDEKKQRDAVAAAEVRFSAIVFQSC